jgi:hypothetical protein
MEGRGGGEAQGVADPKKGLGGKHINDDLYSLPSFVVFNLEMEEYI